MTSKNADEQCPNDPVTTDEEQSVTPYVPPVRNGPVHSRNSRTELPREAPKREQSSARTDKPPANTEDELRKSPIPHCDRRGVSNKVRKVDSFPREDRQLGNTARRKTKHLLIEVFPFGLSQVRGAETPVSFRRGLLDIGERRPDGAPAAGSELPAARPRASPELHSSRSITRTGDEGSFERGDNAQTEKHERNSNGSPQTLGPLSTSGRPRTRIQHRNKNTRDSHKRRGRRSDAPNAAHESSKAKSPAQLRLMGLFGRQHSIGTSVPRQTPDILANQFPNPGNERLQPSTRINLYSINVIRRCQKGFPEE